jgi:hypothetical protein
MDCDPDFNKDFRDSWLTDVPKSFEPMKEFLNPKMERGRLAKFIQELGQEKLDLIVENCIKDYKMPQGLIHNDLHVFNVLVEKKPNVESLEEFAEKGKYTLVDWETAIVGPFSRDVGEFFWLPIFCVLAHGMNGHREIVNSILGILDQFWTDYASALKEEGQHDDEFLCRTYRSAIGWAGYYLYVYSYVLNIGGMMELLCDECQSSVEHVRDSVGYMGFQFMRLAFGNYATDARLESLRLMFRSTIEEEVARLSPEKPRRDRRSSVFRTSGRRFSDADVVFGSLASRDSFSTHLPGIKS